MGIVLLEAVRGIQDPGTIKVETWQRGSGYAWEELGAAAAHVS